MEWGSLFRNNLFEGITHILSALLSSYRVLFIVNKLKLLFSRHTRKFLCKSMYNIMLTGNIEILAIVRFRFFKNKI